MTRKSEPDWDTSTLIQWTVRLRPDVVENCQRIMARTGETRQGLLDRLLRIGVEVDRDDEFWIDPDTGAVHDKLTAEVIPQP